jgi:protein TonB
MLALLSVLLLQATSSGPAPAPPPAVEAGPDVTITQWLRMPTGEDIFRVYPRHASNRYINGFATIRCDLTAVGRLTNCAVIAERPAGEGFGVAALKLSGLFKAPEQTPDGRPIAGEHVTIPIRFYVSP